MPCARLAEDSYVTHFQYTPFVIPLALSAAVVVAMLVVAWRNRDAEVAPWFAASLVALLVWTVGYLLELMAVGVGAKIFWADLHFIATASLPLLWLEVVLIYTGRGRLPVAARAALWAVCVLLVITVFLNPAHLFRGDPSVVMHGSLTALSPDYGPIWRYAGMPWVYGLYFLILLVLLRGMVHARRIYVRQYAALLAATALPLAAGSLYTLGVSPWPEYNPAMPVVAVSGVLMAYALFHYRLFDVAPLARDAVIDELADGLVVVDVESRLRDFNAAARQVFPALSDDAIGRPVDEVLAIHPAMLEGLRREAEPAFAGERPPGDGLVRAHVSVAVPGDEGGSQRDFTLHLTPVRRRGGDVVGHALLLHDVSKSVELLGRLERLASRDELTGLLSRTVWHDAAERELMRARRYRYGLGVALLDLDQLRLVNDAGGQAVGDELLRAVSFACQKVVRPFDILGRVGGDEIAVLLPHLSAAEAGEAGRRLRDAIGALQVAGGEDALGVTACVGVAAVERLTDGMLSGLLHQVERALGTAKRQGPGRVVCAWEC